MSGSSIGIGSDGVGRILLGTGEVAIFDAQDLSLLSGYRWIRSYSKARKPYVYACISKTERVGIARIITKPEPGLVVDHINGDPLDNRRGNLRICTMAQNSRNVRIARDGKSANFKGVSRSTKSKTWRAYGTIDGKQKHLGSFVAAHDAAQAYDDFARTYYGEFAALNFPKAGEQSAHSQPNLTTREHNHGA